MSKDKNNNDDNRTNVTPIRATAQKIMSQAKDEAQAELEVAPEIWAITKTNNETLVLEGRVSVMGDVFAVVDEQGVPYYVVPFAKVDQAVKVDAPMFADDVPLV